MKLILNLFINRYTDDLGSKRNSYNNRNQRFYRHRNMDRMRQERHTLERERNADRSSKRFVINFNV